MVKSSKKALAVLLAVACLITFMPAMASQSFAAKKLTVKPAKKTIYVKKSVTLKANQKVKWSASKSSLKVVKLTSKKAKSVKVTGKKAGKAVVTAKVGKQTKKVTITVKKAKAAVKKTAVTAVALSADNAKDPAKEVLVGTKLRAAVTPENATVTYQWKADGTAIAGATGSTFTVTTAEIGKAITVEATGTGNFEKTAVSAATAKVAAVKINSVVTLGKYVAATADTKANYDGNASQVGVGDVLKAKMDVENADAADAVTYQWYRIAKNAAQNEYDTAIEGATSETYTVTAADKGANLYVVVTPKSGVVVKNGVAVKDGKLKSDKSGEVSAAVKVEIQVDGKTAPVAVTLGKTLTAVVTPSTANVTFQWKKGGVAIPGATSATYKPEVKGTYTVEAKLADNEMVFASVTQADSVTITDQTINAAILKDLKDDGSAKPVAVGDKLNLTVYAKNADGMDVALTSGYKTEMYINGAKAYPADTTDFTSPNAASIDANANVPTTYRLKGDTDNRPVKVNDTISFKVIGTGDYAGVELDSNALSVAKLGTLTSTDVSSVTAKQVDNAAKIHIAGLTKDDGLTATIFKVTGTGTTATYAKIGAVTFKDTQNGAVDFALDSDVSKNHDKYVVSVSKADYDGSVDLSTIELAGLAK